MAGWLMSWRNKSVLGCFLNVPRVSQFRGICGKLFHITTFCIHGHWPAINCVTHCEIDLFWSILIGQTGRQISMYANVHEF